MSTPNPFNPLGAPSGQDISKIPMTVKPAAPVFWQAPPYAPLYPVSTVNDRSQMLANLMYQSLYLAASKTGKQFSVSGLQQSVMALSADQLGLCYECSEATLPDPMGTNILLSLIGGRGNVADYRPGGSKYAEYQSILASVQPVFVAEPPLPPAPAPVTQAPTPDEVSALAARVSRIETMLGIAT